MSQGTQQSLPHESTDIVKTLTGVRDEIFSLGLDRLHTGEYSFEILQTEDYERFYSTPLRYKSCPSQQACITNSINHPNMVLFGHSHRGTLVPTIPEDYDASRLLRAPGVLIAPDRGIRLYQGLDDGRNLFQTLDGPPLPGEFP